MIPRWSVCSLCGLLILGGFGCATSGNTGHKQAKYRYTKHRYTSTHTSHSKYGRLGQFDVPMVMNDRVMAWIDYFTGSNRDRFERYLQRSGRYMTLFRRVLREQGLPEDLVYIALIESGFLNRATSHASAAGTWQFIQSTARRYGLGIDSWVDQRRDPEMAVVAAAKYLKDLHNEFGDWYLAMAGYNAGEGRVREAIARYGTKDFWALSAPGTNVFRAETREYVPKYIAAAVIAKNPEQFGFHNVQYQTPWQYETARVDSQTDLQVVAECANTSLEEIQDLNPDLRSGLTPPGSHEVRLPIGTGKRFHVAFARVPKSDRVRIAYHLVERRETLPQIARRYGVSVREIMAANSIRRPKDLRRGQQLVIPRVRGGSFVPAVEVASKSAREPRLSGAREGGGAAIYRVRRGDSLVGIAARFGVSMADLREWNGLTGRSGKVLRGQQLKVSAPTAVATAPEVAATSVATTVAAAESGSLSDRMTPEPEAVEHEVRRLVDAAIIQPSQPLYTVGRGDSWHRIAEKHGVTVRDLKEWNPDIALAGSLRIGQRLVVSSPTTVEAPVAPLATESKESVARDRISQVAPRASDLLAMREVAPEPASMNTVQEMTAVAPMEMPTVAASKSAPHPSAKAANPRAHTVRSGDTLSAIAGQYGVTIADLRRMNRLSPKGMLQPGQKVVVKNAEAQRPARTPSARATIGGSDQLAMASGAPARLGTKRVIHRVKAGDTIWDLSRVYKVSPEQIKAWNNLSRPMLKPGQTLTIHLQSGRS